MKVKIGKGVLSKDNKTPFALRTIHTKSKDGFMRPRFAHFDPLAAMAEFFKDKDATELQIIDENNRQFTFIKDK